MIKAVSNWGNYPTIDTEVEIPFELSQIRQTLQQKKTGIIARGLGRCYGDASLGSTIIQMDKLDRFAAFDEQKGELTCEAGVSLASILTIFVPRGWFLGVTPGTKFVSIGGAIAADVHGKNHHKEGAFADHVVEIVILTADGATITCSKQEKPDLFWATCGGMGLTGVILFAKIQLRKIESAYISQEAIQAENLENLVAIIEQSSEWTYTVAWIDCFSTGKAKGRGVLMRGEHALEEDLPPNRQITAPLILPAKWKLSIPFQFPAFVLNTYSIKTFNHFFYHKQKLPMVQTIIDYDQFFYPLDHINNWNRMYGKNGFVQYQCVIPEAESLAGLSELLDEIIGAQRGSFLAVLKKFGPEKGVLSFPCAGYTLALDFKVDPGLWAFLDRLDKIVLRYGGRLYLAKDARMSQTFFEQTYGNIDAFKKVLTEYNPQGRFCSLQAKRLGLIT